MKTPLAIAAFALATGLTTALSGCSPKFDWRDYRSADAPYSILFPGKPATHTRTVNLDGQQTSMTMAAADVDGTMFAVGSTELVSPAAAQQAAQAMKTAMLRNISGIPTKEGSKNGGVALEAHGTNGGRAIALHGRFVARGNRAYQAIVVGPDKAVDREAIETFLTSFKPD
ncbi:hypothetical protein IP92_00002 [Pseudoduganella flava]|uniref:DUF1795 domain-containing protein n=1 Tax=Pseudoduganella flava TaxID=871742 RepID=A0A562Q4E3_9BURK|nr:hypothetical protein [Pseudoduganella flava]QGZ41097.1 hypothetical protein GO485_19925 [Pseudoduganella flava]TWI51020.1 hypothetical protein IP92_00002 [Pseudoduganella flava]